jgi:N-acetyl sugar amidotransferase
MNQESSSIKRKGEPGYQQCTATIMDTTDPEIRFNEAGVCHWVTEVFPRYRQVWNPEGNQEAFERTIRQIKQDGAGKKYDCILGLSGGLDSSYLALIARRAGLKPLLIHTDTGWNTELAVSNIEKIIKHCGFDLHTHVINWREMADVQRAFLRAGVNNQDIPQDHAIFAALYAFATRHGIKWVLNGSNFAGESVLPPAWGFPARDVRHIKAVHRRFGEGPLGSFPRMGNLKYGLIFVLLRGMRVAKLLNHVPYHRQKAIDELTKEMGWRYYGSKHYESRWTRYFQGWWLPTKFGYDKRLAHFSSLILSGQITREEALHEMEHDHYPERVRLEDQEFIIKKLDMKEAEFHDLLKAPVHSHYDYPNSDKLTRLTSRFRHYLPGSRKMRQ